MPAVAGLVLLAGLNDFDLAVITLAVGIGITWWNDVRDKSTVDKKSVSLRVVWWLLAGVALQMLKKGEVAPAVVLAVILVLWWMGKLSGLAKMFPKWKISGSGGKKSSDNTDADSVDSASVRTLVTKMECDRLLKNAYYAAHDLKHQYFAHDIVDLLAHVSIHDHHIEKLDLFPYYAARVRMCTEKRELVKMPCKLDSSKSNGKDRPEGDVWSLPLGEQDSTYRVEECTECHGQKRITCPTCHNEHSQWDCPDCHGEAGHMYKCTDCGGKGEYECPDCHGKGDTSCPECKGEGKTMCGRCDGTGHERCIVCNGDGYHSTYRKVTCPECHGTKKVFRNGNTYSCDCCHSDGYVMEPCKEKCTRCDGKGYGDCNACNGKGHLRCDTCRGEGKIQCRTCRHAGKVTCETCKGKGEVKCGKCESTGIERCRTCRGTGKVACPKCHGDGGFAFVWNVKSETTAYQETKIWSDSSIPKGLVPKLVPNSDAVNGTLVIYRAESRSIVPDDAIVLSEEALKYPYLKGMYDKVAAKIKCSDSVHVSEQRVDVMRVEHIARVEIRSTYESKYSDFAGKTFICWLNLATGEFLDIGLKEARPDSWYENHELSESAESPYGMLAKGDSDKKYLPEIWRLTSRLGNPVGMAGFGRYLCEHRTSLEDMSAKEKSKSYGPMLLFSAEQLGVVHSSCVDEFEWTEELGEEIISRFAKLFKFNDSKSPMRRVLFDPNRMKEDLVYPLQYLPNDLLADVLSASGYDGFTHRAEHLAAFCSWDKFSDIQRRAILQNSPGIVKAMTQRATFTPAAFAAVLEDKWHMEENMQKYDFARISKAYTTEDWVEFLAAYDGTDFERFVERVNWKQIGNVSAEKLTALASSKNWMHFGDKVDWSLVSIEKLIAIDIKAKNDDARKSIDWESRKGELQTFDLKSLTDDERVIFASDKKSIASIALRDGFDPNAIRPWSLWTALRKWPERCKSFNPDKYDWLKVSPKMWARILWEHPEYRKYCDAKKVDWGKLDVEKPKFWAMAVASCPEEVVELCTKWSKIPEDMWPEMLERRPSLVKYRKK